MSEASVRRFGTDDDDSATIPMVVLVGHYKWLVPMHVWAMHVTQTQQNWATAAAVEMDLTSEEYIRQNMFL